MIGMMANAARHEPEAVAALRAGRDDRMTRILRLPLPEPYSPTRVEALRDRLRSKRQPDKPQRTANQKPSGGRGGRSAGPQAAHRRTARSDVKSRARGWGHAPSPQSGWGDPHPPAGGGHHGGEQRYTGQRRASTEHGRAKGRVLEGQHYG
jgi:cell division protein FtsW